MKNQKRTDIRKKTSGLPEARRPEAMTFDLPALAELPDNECEAAIHLALDRIVELSERDSLAGLSSVIDLMQKINVEIYKSYAAVGLRAAQTTAVLSQPTGGLSGGQQHGHGPMSRDQGRLLASLTRLQEAIVKMGVAKVKTEDEIRQRTERKIGR